MGVGRAEGVGSIVFFCPQYSPFGVFLVSDHMVMFSVISVILFTGSWESGVYRVRGVRGSMIWGRGCVRGSGGPQCLGVRSGDPWFGMGLGSGGPWSGINSGDQVIYGQRVRPGDLGFRGRGRGSGGPRVGSEVRWSVCWESDGLWSRGVRTGTQMVYDRGVGCQLVHSLGWSGLRGRGWYCLVIQWKPSCFLIFHLSYLL